MENKPSKNSALDKERSNLNNVSSTFVLGSISGIVLLVAQSVSAWAQITLLFHIAVGLIFTYAIGLYTYQHFQRTVGIRKPLVNLCGFALVIALAAYLTLAIRSLFVGHMETESLHQSIHRYGGLALCLLFISHVGLYLSLRYRNRSGGNELKTLNTNTLRATGHASLLFCLLTLLSLGIYSLAHKNPGPAQAPENYEYTYGDHPFRPSQTETNNSQFIHPHEIAGSEFCGSCHQEITEQWQRSAHRLAASDPTYVTNVSLLAEKKGISATRYCEGCHAPIALLTGELTEGGEHGGIEGTLANHEGISCVSCHRMTKAVHLDGVASYHFDPAEEYLFQYTDNQLLTQINRFLIHVSATQHENDMTPDNISDPSYCATCHAQFMDASMNDWGWVKMQDEYRAWLQSPYSQKQDQAFANNTVVRCQDCHMPLVPGDTDPSADENGLVRSHAFLGGNTMLPFLLGDEEHLQNTINFLQSNKMRISIKEPNRKDAIQSILNLDERLRQHTETPFYFYLGEEATLDIAVTNVGVGHDFPGGTTDINQAWVAIDVQDASGNTIYQSGQIQEDDFLDPSSYIYQSIPIDRHGKHVWKHDLFNMTGETYKNVVKAGETDILQIKFVVPSWAKSPIAINTTLKYRKLNTRYAKWALKDKYQTLPIVDMAKDTLLISLLEEPSAVGNKVSTK